MKSYIKTLGLSLVAAAVLTACGGGSSSGGTTDTTAPVIDSSLSTKTVNTTATEVLTLSADETATFAIAGGANQSLFEISSNKLNFKTAQAAGTYVVNVTATDSANNTSSAFTITVTVAATTTTKVNEIFTLKNTGADMTKFAWIKTLRNVHSTDGAKTVETLNNITADTTLDATKVYEINGKVTVSNNATLTIPAGTTLYGKTAQSFLAITMGSKIDAQGTSTNPIIFTSKEDFEGKNNGAEQGQWGGLTILGKAVTNKGQQDYEADATLKFGTASTDAGSDDADNSGTLKFVVVKHTGYEVATDAELNGISFGGVGSGTTVEDIAVIGGKDDGIELWGGTVNLTNAYVYNAGDDSLDTDNGYRGTVTNAYLEQYNNLSSDPRGIEADGKSKTDGGTPSSMLTINGLTIKTTSDANAAIRLREGTDANITNAVVYAAGGKGIQITDQVTIDAAPTLSGVSLVAAKDVTTVAGDGATDAAAKSSDAEASALVDK